jgi:hypothetical protein
MHPYGPANENRLEILQAAAKDDCRLDIDKEIVLFVPFHFSAADRLFNKRAIQIEWIQSPSEFPVLGIECSGSGNLKLLCPGPIGSVVINLIQDPFEVGLFTTARHAPEIHLQRSRFTGAIGALGKAN